MVSDSWIWYWVGAPGSCIKFSLGLATPSSYMVNAVLTVVVVGCYAFIRFLRWAARECFRIYVAYNMGRVEVLFRTEFEEAKSVSKHAVYEKVHGR